MIRKPIHPNDIQKTLTGTKLRSYAYAVLAKREYSRAELRKKLLLYAIHEHEVDELIEEFCNYNYQNDERYAHMLFRSQLQKGKGPQSILQALQKKEVDTEYLAEEIKETNWLEEAYKLKIRKFGDFIETDQKKKAKQIRFLQYRGYNLDVILKVVNKDYEDFY